MSAIVLGLMRLTVFGERETGDYETPHCAGAVFSSLLLGVTIIMWPSEDNQQ
jgi:hypothetical protein